MQTLRPLGRRHAARALGAVLAIAAAVALTTGCGSSGSSGSKGPVFLSSQGSELTEAQGMRTKVLDGFTPKASFVPVADDPTAIDRLTAESKSGKGTADLVGLLHGGFVSLEAKDTLLDVSDVAAELKGAGIDESLWKLGKLGTSTQHYIPWIQASYVMVANKKALPFLPAGADVNSLTYDQLMQWAQNVQAKEKQPKLGFPASGNGVLKRFLEGYLTPSFSGGMVTTFKSPQAIAGWDYLHRLWKHVNPQSLTYDFMSDPLLSGEVWIAWDHVARIQAALDARPDEFVVFPAPSGPKGRGYMPVVSGLGIPKTAPHPAQAKALIKYLVSPAAQAKTLSAIGFFPVVGGNAPSSISPGLKLEVDAVRRQQTAPDALQALLPTGLGGQGDAFDKAFTDTFTRIIVHGDSPAKAVADGADAIQSILDQTHAPCWAPDPPSSGVCKVG